MAKAARLILMMCIVLISVANCGPGKRVIRVRSDPARPAERTALLDLHTPVANFRDDFSPGTFRLHVGEKSFEIGRREMLQIDAGPCVVEIEAEPLEQVRIRTWVGFHPRVKAYLTHGVVSTGRNLFYPDRRARLRFTAESGRTYRCRFHLSSEKDETVYALDCWIVEKHGKRGVSNRDRIRFSRPSDGTDIDG